MDVETEGRVIVVVRVTNAAADQGQMTSVVEQEEQRYEQAAREHLVDGGFVTHRDIQEVPAKGAVVYAPIPEAPAVTKPHHRPPEAPPAAVIAWCMRLEIEGAQAITNIAAAPWNA